MNSFCFPNYLSCFNPACFPQIPGILGHFFIFKGRALESLLGAPWLVIALFIVGLLWKATVWCCSSWGLQKIEPVGLLSAGGSVALETPPSSSRNLFLHSISLLHLHVSPPSSLLCACAGSLSYREKGEAAKSSCSLAVGWSLCASRLQFNSHQRLHLQACPESFLLPGAPSPPSLFLYPSNEADSQFP